MLSPPCSPVERLPDDPPMVDANRYMEFLVSALPELAATRLYAPRWPFRMRRFAVLDRALREAAPRPGIGLEFGVYRGASLIRSARRCPARRFYGFDSFAGLPPDGRPDWQVNFATVRLPKLPANCALVPGWFADTIPLFLRERQEPIAFVNIDCDIYSSARAVLFGLAERLQPGAVLYFDELINYDTFLWNEMLALFEFLEATGLGVEWLAVHGAVRSAAETFASYEAGHYPPWQLDVASGYHRPAAAILTAGQRNLEMSPRQDREVARLAAKFEHFSRQYAALRPTAHSGAG